VALALVGAWNVRSYNWLAGDDARQHAIYADFLWEHGRIPSRDTTVLYYNPPGFYAVAGALGQLGRELGLAEPKPRKLVQYLNVALLVGIALLTFLTARLLWPERLLVHLAALGFVAATPIVVELAAMYNPELLSAFLATLGLYLAARLLVTRSFRALPALGVGIALGAAQLVRPISLLLLAAVLAVLGAAALAALGPRRQLAACALAVVLGAGAVCGWWYVRQARHYGSPVAFTHPAFTERGRHVGSGVGPTTLETPLWRRRPLSFYVDPGLPEVVTRPYRPAFIGAGVPVTYSSLWGDWIGHWTWGIPGEPGRDRPVSTRELSLQNLAGLLPTLLGIAGFVLLLAGCGRALSRRDDPSAPARLLVPLVILLVLVWYAYWVVKWPAPDGDVLTARFLLAAVPAWALAAAYALGRLSRTRLFVPVLVLLLAAAVLDLRFLVRGSALGGLL
jgi:hypothetical protein